MPCMDGRERETEAMAQRIACYLLATLEAAGHPPPPFAREWWREHQEFDRAERRTPEYDKRLAATIIRGTR